MKKIIIAAAALLACGLSASAQAKKPQINWPDYQFTTVKANPITPVKNQYRSGTCWCYSTLGFIESEVIRINDIKDTLKYPDFSEMFVVGHSYSDRATKFVRLDGNLTFSAGSSADDVMHVIEDYGLVPQEAMPGMNYGTEKPVQAELDAVLKGYVKAVAANPNKTLTTAWKAGFDGIIAAYFGEYPKTFTVDGKIYTPQTYRKTLGIKPEDYISLSSFDYQPYYKWAPVEVADNWRWDSAYNVPLDEFMEIVDGALEAGYTIAWGADVSEPGFTRDGLAILVDVEATNNSGSDQDHWVGKDEGAPAPVVNNVVEKEVTVEGRRIAYDNKTITDDHGMQIFGIAKDQWGAKYYMVKNSWGETGKYKGIWHASPAFVKNQTMDIIIHKSALPKGFIEKHPNANR